MHTINLSGFSQTSLTQEIEKAYQEGVYSDTPANKKLGRAGMTYKQYELLKNSKPKNTELIDAELEVDDIKKFIGELSNDLKDLKEESAIKETKNEIFKAKVVLKQKEGKVLVLKDKESPKKSTKREKFYSLDDFRDALDHFEKEGNSGYYNEDKIRNLFNQMHSEDGPLAGALMIDAFNNYQEKKKQKELDKLNKLEDKSSYKIEAWHKDIEDLFPKNRSGIYKLGTEDGSLVLYNNGKNSMNTDSVDFAKMAVKAEELKLDMKLVGKDKTWSVIFKPKKDIEKLLEKVTDKEKNLIPNEEIEELASKLSQFANVESSKKDIIDELKKMSFDKNMKPTSDLSKMTKILNFTSEAGTENYIRVGLRHLIKNEEEKPLLKIEITPTFLNILKEATQDNDHNGAYVAVAKKFKREDDMKALIELNKKNKKGLDESAYKKQQEIYKNLMNHIKENYGEEIYKKIYDQL